MEDCPLKAPGVLEELLADGSMVLYDKTSRQLMTLNPTAALVWEYCDASQTPATIAEEIRTAFPEVPTIAADVAAVLQDLRGRRMLTDDR